MAAVVASISGDARAAAKQKFKNVTYCFKQVSNAATETETAMAELKEAKAKANDAVEKAKAAAEQAASYALVAEDIRRLSGTMEERRVYLKEFWDRKHARVYS